jgi:hypothetical protein
MESRTNDAVRGAVPAYVNAVRLTTDPFEVILDFGFREPVESGEAAVAFQSSARLVISPALAAAIVPLLDGLLVDYEEEVDRIASVAFEGLADEMLTQSVSYPPTTVEELRAIQRTVDARETKPLVAAPAHDANKPDSKEWIALPDPGRTHGVGVTRNRVVT